MSAMIRGFRVRSMVVVLITLLLLATSALVAVSGDSVIATIPVGRAPGALAVNPLTHRLYCANYQGASMSIIDGPGSSVLATVPTGSGLVYPITVAIDHLATPARAFVGNFWSGTLVAVNESSYATASTLIGSAHGGGPRALVVDGASTPHRLFVVSYGRGVVEVLDASTLAPIATITVGDLPRAIAYYPGSGNSSRLYVVNRSSNSVSVINGRTYSVVGTVTVAAGARSVTIDPDTGIAYATSDASNVVTVIRPDATVATTLAVGVAPSAVAVDAARDRLFVANSGSGNVTVIDTVTNTRAATVTVDAGPSAIAVDSTAGKTYVANRSAGTVSIIDAALASTSIAVGGSPTAVVVDTSNNPHLAYVSNAASDTVSVIDEPAAQSALTLSKAVAEDPEPVALIVDPIPPAGSGGVTITGRAVSQRTPVPLDIAQVLWREAGSSVWNPAETVVTPGSGAATFSFTYTGGSTAPQQLEIIAFDALGAVSVSSDQGINAMTPEVGGRALVDVTTVDPNSVIVGKGRFGQPRTRVSFDAAAWYPPGSTHPTGRFVANLPDLGTLRDLGLATLSCQGGTGVVSGPCTVGGRLARFEFTARDAGRGAAKLRVWEAGTGTLLGDYSAAGELVPLSSGHVSVFDSARLGTMGGRRGRRLQ